MYLVLSHRFIKKIHFQHLFIHVSVVVIHRLSTSFSLQYTSTLEFKIYLLQYLINFVRVQFDSVSYI